MADRIKGITIELDGDTTKLSNALKGVNKEIRDTQSNLKDVNKLLKMDPGNADLLTQKQKYLSEAISATKKKLEEEKLALQQLKSGPQTEETRKQQEALTREIEATNQSLKSLEKEYRNFGSVAGAQLQAVGSKMKETGGKISDVGGTISKNVTLPIVAVGAAAVKVTSDFDSSMSQVEAISGATGNDLQSLRDKAKEMGETTKFSASESADAMTYMAMAGWKTQDMLNGISGVMNLAAASGEDLAATSDILTDGLTAFGLTAADSGRMADVMAAASANANTNVSLLGESYKYCAATAGAMGYSVEDITESLGLMANAGVKGSQAGTSLKTAMINLAKPTSQMSAAMDKYGISILNTDGSMKSWNEVVNNLRSSLGGLSESEQTAAVATIFGKEATAGMMSVINAAPADIEKLSSSIDNSAGSAENMAAVMNDNLEGKVTILKSALEGLGISIGEIIIPAISDIVGFIQKVVDGLNSLSPGVKDVIVKIALVAAAIGPVLIVVGKVISSVGSILGVVGKLTSFLPSVGAAIAGCSAPILPIIGIIALVASAIALVIVIIKNWGAISEWFKGVWEKVCEGVKAIGQSLGDFFLGLWEGIKSVTETVWNAIVSFFTGIWNGIRNTAATVFNAIKDFFLGLWEGIKNTASAAWEGIKTGLYSVWNGIRNTASTVFNGVKDFFTATWKGIKNAAGDAWSGIQTGLSTIWTTISTAASTVFTGVKDFIGNTWNTVSSTAATVWGSITATLGNAWNNVKTTCSNTFENVRNGIGNAWENVKSNTSAAWDTIKTSIQEKGGGIKGVIGTAVEGYKSLWTAGFSKINEITGGKLGEALGSARSKLDSIRSVFQSKMDSAKSIVSNALGNIKSFFANCHLSLPHIKLPHFSISGSFSLNPPSVPHLSVSWYKKAMDDAYILNDPTIFGMAGGRLLGGGEAGPEAIVGTDKLSQIVKDAIAGMGGGTTIIPVYIGQERIDEIVVKANKRNNFRSGGR